MRCLREHKYLLLMNPFKHQLWLDPALTPATRIVCELWHATELDENALCFTVASEWLSMDGRRVCWARLLLFLFSLACYGL